MPGLSSEPVIEILRFRLRTGADEEAFVAADKRLQAEFAYQQPGLLRRTVARGEGQEWVVLSLWATPDSADAGDMLWAPDDTCRAFRSFIDPGTVRSERFVELD